MTDLIDSIRKKFNVHFKVEHPKLPALASVFNAMFKSSKSLVACEGGVLFDRTKVNTTTNAETRVPMYESFIRWLSTAESKEFNITEVQKPESQQKQEESGETNHGDAFISKIREAALQAVESAITKVNEAALNAARETRESLRREQQEEIRSALETQRESDRARYDAERSETIQRVGFLENRFTAFNAERLADPSPPPPQVTQQQFLADRQQLHNVISSLEQRIKDLSVRTEVARPAAVGNPDIQRDETRRRNLKRGRDEEDEGETADETPRKREGFVRVVRRTSTQSPDGLLSLPYRVIRQCTAIVLGEHVVREWEIDGAKNHAASSSKK